MYDLLNTFLTLGPIILIVILFARDILDCGWALNFPESTIVLQVLALGVLITLSYTLCFAPGGGCLTSLLNFISLSLIHWHCIAFGQSGYKWSGYGMDIARDVGYSASFRSCFLGLQVIAENVEHKWGLASMLDICDTCRSVFLGKKFNWFSWLARSNTAHHPCFWAFWPFLLEIRNRHLRSQGSR